MIRHGENIVNSSINNDLLQLTENGKQQAENARKRIGAFDIVISSTSMRCIMTAKIIMNGGKPLRDIRLLERGWGNKEHDGKETDEQAKIRFIEVLTDIAKLYHGKNIVIVTHGTLMKLAQDIIENKCAQRETVNNCDIIKYDKNGEKIVLKCLI